MIKKLVMYIKQPLLIIIAIGKRSKIVPDKLYLMAYFRYIFYKKLDLKNPKTFNEKLQWLKLYNRKFKYSMLVDKSTVKNYIEKIIGSKYIIPTLGLWNNFSDIQFENLPEQFVIKCTHDSGSTLICKNKNTFNFETAKKYFESKLKYNFYLSGREWPYKNVKPRIIVEKLLTQKEGCDIADYKFFCFNGLVDCVMVGIERSTGSPKFYFFDINWNLLRLNIRGINAPKDFTLVKPKNFTEMVEIASILSKGLPFVRVDLYESNEKVFFGEMTFFPQSGFDKLITEEAEKRFGDLIIIPPVNV